MIIWISSLNGKNKEHDKNSLDQGEDDEIWIMLGFFQWCEKMLMVVHDKTVHGDRSNLLTIQDSIRAMWYLATAWYMFMLMILTIIYGLWGNYTVLALEQKLCVVLHSVGMAMQWQQLVMNMRKQSILVCMGIVCFFFFFYLFHTLGDMHGFFIGELHPIEMDLRQMKHPPG